MKIAIVNAVASVTEALRQVVLNTQEHAVIWMAHNGQQAVQFCAANRPDLILMDLRMPDMDGVDTTRLIMQNSPCAILIVTASPEDNTNLVFRALGAGALDATATPVMSNNFAADHALLTKIRTIGKLILADMPPNGHPTHVSPNSPPVPAHSHVETLVAIGASTGGPIAMAKILDLWKPTANSTLIIVQHIDQAFTDGFAKWLADQIDFPVEVIEEDSQLRSGTIFVAKTNDHVVLGEDLRLRYSATPLDYPYRPSIDVFFHCVAQHWRKKAIGVLLTGMGRDGARGLLAMRSAGKLTIAQDKASSAVYGMPKAAADIHAAELILPLENIAPMLTKRINDCT